MTCNILGPGMEGCKAGLTVVITSIALLTQPYFRPKLADMDRTTTADPPRNLDTRLGCWYTRSVILVFRVTMETPITPALQPKLPPTRH